VNVAMHCLLTSSMLSALTDSRRSAFLVEPQVPEKPELDVDKVKKVKKSLLLPCVPIAAEAGWYGWWQLPVSKPSRPVVQILPLLLQLVCCHQRAMLADSVQLGEAVCTAPV
jgi:hypothetical protein